MNTSPEDEILRLKLALTEANKSFDAARYFRDLVKTNEALDVRRRRKDNFKLPSCVYETLEDIGRLDGALAMLDTMWNKDEDYRKASMHLSRLAWELRKKLHEFL